MSKFLQKTTDFIFEKYEDSVSDLCIVLPNRRGGVFLKKYLAERFRKTIWSPAIYSVEDFMMTLSGLQLAENIHLLFELFGIHRELEGKEAQPFQEFASWGQQLLQDFNEIDSYLADPVQIFEYLTDARAISVWNLDQGPLTDFQKKYLGFYKSLYRYYQKLTERLLAGNLAHHGLLFRHTALHIDELKKQVPWKKIIFAGFNALTKAEEIVINSFVIDGKAELLWDSDDYYLSDGDQEAGQYLRQWKKKWNSEEFHWIEKEFATGEKKITITGVPFNIGQVKYCGDILSGLPADNSSHEDTAVVLMDEKLLIPLLNSLPDNIDSLNITMGLTLKQSPLFSLFDALFQMHENVEKFQHSGAGGKIRFYFRDVLRILQHPLLAKFADSKLEGNRFSFDELTRMVRSGNRVFLEKDDILPLYDSLFHQSLEFLDPIFSMWSTPEEAVEYIKKLIANLRDSQFREPAHQNVLPGNSEVNIDLEYLFAFSKVVFQLSGLMKKYDAVRNLKTFHQLFNRIAETTSLPFYGEPLKGIQVMGMLETRTLDFSNLILMSVNEDLIPGSKMDHSFIPYDIRRDFSLPTHHHKNSVYAYHFYRLLQRATNIHLIYNTEPDELGGGEKSRFIKQIQQELPAYNKKIQISEQLLATQPSAGSFIPKITIEKSNEIFDRLKGLAVKGFAPTSMNAYRRCRLQFYFSAIAGIEEPKEQEETIDPQILGQAVHEVLHNLYKPFIDKFLSGEFITSMIPLIREYTDKAFEKKFKGSDLAYGKNLLLVNVAKIMITNFLNEEKRIIEQLSDSGTRVLVKFLEQFIESRLAVQTGNETLDVRIKGFVDRVDQYGSVLRIIDYKTGFADKKELQFEDWSQFSTSPDMDKCFQLLTYAWLMNQKEGIKTENFEAGIISLKKISSGFLSLSLPGNDTKGGIDPSSLKIFEEILSKLLTEIFDPGIPFDQTEDLKICSRCTYINLCGR